MLFTRQVLKINQKSKEKVKAPLFKVVKRSDTSAVKAAILRIAAVAGAFVFGGIFIAFLGHSPAEVYKRMYSGSFGTQIAFRATVQFVIPMIICALGVTLAFKMKFWNIGAEGQMIIGAVFASYFALFHADLPRPVLLLAMFFAAIIGSGVWGMIPAFFKARFGTNETLFTLMLNYVASAIIVYLKDGPWKDPTAMGFNKIAMFEASARLPRLAGFPFGILAALILVVMIYIYLKYTKSGYEIAVTGESRSTAAYAGMNVKKIIIRTMFFSAAVSGIAGMMQVAGTDFTLAESVAGGVGFTAIIIAWLSQLNPLTIVAVSFLFSFLKKGGASIEQTFKISSSASNIFQGLIIFFVLACEFFISYQIVFRRGEKNG